MIQFLANVHLERMSPQLGLGLVIAASIVQANTTAEMVVTSMGDGVHSSKDSKHYPDTKGLVNGADIRIRNFDGAEYDISNKDRLLAKVIVAKMKESLGPQFDVVLESNHIHMEFDPKNVNNFVVEGGKGKYI